MPADDPLSARLRRAYRAILVLGGVCLALAAAFVVAVMRGDAGFDAETRARLDPEVREEVVERLARDALGIWDALPDPDVGRVLQPNREVIQAEQQVRSNHFGLREREFTLAKPRGVLRIVLLGDSYVYGQGIAADQRVGVHLERMLRERLPGSQGIECLHFGLSSWNLRGECAFLRRQLSMVQPDLVVHVLVGNDLDDGAGVRGMGVPAGFSPGQRARADAMIWRNYPQEVLRGRSKGWLIRGLDHESRRRYEQGAADLLGLARAVEAVGGRYLVASNWPIPEAPVARQLLFADLPQEQVLLLSSREFRDPAYRLSKVDAHWNAEGCENVATILYGVLRRRALLPGVDLPEWPEAEALAERIERAGRRTAERSLPGPEGLPIGPELEPHRWDDDMRAQVHGGIDRNGAVSPHASVILRGGGRELVLQGTSLGRAELAGATVVIRVEGVVIGQTSLPATGPIQARFPLGDEHRGQAFVTVELDTDDYVYDRQKLRHCIAFQLERLAIE